MRRWGDFTLSPYLPISLLFFSRESHLVSISDRKKKGSHLDLTRLECYFLIRRKL